MLLQAAERKKTMGCRLCPRECNADRNNGEVGYCGEAADLRVARAALHMWEEPCISGKSGSGTVFFTGCPLKCVFCQNNSIAQGKAGKPITPGRLSEIFLELQEKGACNINLVTPTHFVPQLIPALQTAKSCGLSIPVVYNTGSYEKMEALQSLEGLIDIYLPDLKYVSSRLSSRYSNAADYFETASAAIGEMFRQTGAPVIDADSGIMQRGVIVRHLMLPGHLADSKRVMEYLVRTYGNAVFISILSQYTPIRYFSDFSNLSRRLSKKEYNQLVDFCLALGIENGFIQEGESAEESFIPSFDCEGI